jgi:hypothetical protein
LEAICKGYADTFLWITRQATKSIALTFFFIFFIILLKLS